MPEFNPNQLVRFNEAGQLVDADTGELMPPPEPRRVCANTLGLVASPRLTDQQRSRRDAFLGEQERLHNAAVLRRRKAKNARKGKKR
jgi:hypothetical protein